MTAFNMNVECLKTVQNLLERADCALLPQMEDTPTARDEIKQARHMLSVVIDCLENTLPADCNAKETHRNEAGEDTYENPSRFMHDSNANETKRPLSAFQILDRDQRNGGRG